MAAKTRSRASSATRKKSNQTENFWKNKEYFMRFKKTGAIFG